MRVAGVGAAIALGAGIVAATAAAQGGGEPWAPWRTTVLMSRSMSGGFPNGPSRNAVVSQDGRWGSVVAFESDASDLVPGDANGATDVFAVHRREPYPDNGTMWEIGGTELVSVGLGGAPANGRSYGPAADGAPEFTRAHCVAFVSEASNLVRGDTNGQPDAFVRDLRRKRTVRVSVDSRGRQANGPTTEVSIDGDCTRVAFTSRATNLAMAKTSVKRQRVARTRRPPRGTRQVYVHALPWVKGVDKPWRDATFLASANDRGVAGNGDSFDPSIATQKGKAVAFTSTSTNLARGDGNGATDVYLRSMGWKLSRWRTRLVSANPSGRAGNGASRQPSADGAGLVIAYATDASDVISGDANAHSDIARADMRAARPVQYYVSHGNHGGPGNGASSDPAISYGAQFVMFESQSSNFEPAPDARVDTNGVGDAFLWTINRRRVFTESVSSDGGQLGLPSTNPQQSSHGNYLFFETSDPLVDLAVVRSSRPDLLKNPSAARSQAAQTPAYHQVYLRYLGPQ